MHSTAIICSLIFVLHIRLGSSRALISCRNIETEELWRACVRGGGVDTHLGAPARACPACPDVQEQLRVVILPVLQTVLGQLQAGMLD